MGNIIDELVQRMRSSALTAIIGINVAVWLLLRIAAIVVFFATGVDGEQAVSQWVELPADLVRYPWHIYGLLTYMFSQYGVLHLLFNMLWIYWFGRMFLDISSERSLWLLYLYGGLSGALLFLAAYNLLPAFSGQNAWLIGSSASVLAIVTATAVLMPDYPVGLLLIGQVKLKWIAVATVVLVLLGIDGANAGGEIAHVGGMVMGAVYAMARKRGRDLTAIPRFRRRGRRRKAESRSESPRQADRAELDDILDKIRRSGYGGLTAEEKKRLFDVSSRIK